MSIWEPLGTHPAAPDGLFSELYPELSKALRPIAVMILSEENHLLSNPDDEMLVRAASDPIFARQRFQQILPTDFLDERRLRHFFNEAAFIIEDFDDDSFHAAYTDLVSAYLTRFNLRYAVARPFSLVPTLPGIASALLSEVERASESSQHLNTLKGQMLRTVEILSKESRSEDLCRFIATACNLSEGLAGAHADARSRTLGEMIRQTDLWPHVTVREAFSKLYGFCSDYPGIRHAGNPDSRLREISSKDGLLVSVILLAFSGYFLDFDVEDILCTSEVPQL